MPEPMRADRRLERMSNVRRALAGLLPLFAAIAMTAVPMARVAACSCAMTTLADAVRTAEVAFVGTLVSADVPEGGLGVGDERATYTWQFERTAQQVDTNRLSVTGWPDSGANCGVTFGADERWLVLTYLAEGRLETNSCLPNQRLDGSAPDVETQVSELLTVVAPASAPPASPSGVPLPFILAGTAVVLVAGVGVLAFRRRG